MTDDLNSNIGNGILETVHMRKIAFVKKYFGDEKDNKPGILFLGGFRSDMEGTKAKFLEDWSSRQKYNFLKFDYSGHGRSSNLFENGCITDWKNDACEVLDKLTKGPQSLVGSSMGGWISILIAKLRPDRCRALIGIAAAPDFTENSFWAGFDDTQRTTLLDQGMISLPSDYSHEPYVITKKLIEDGRSNLVMDEPLNLPVPLRLLQGMRDNEVHYSEALKLADNWIDPDVKITLVKDADHQFSSPKCLGLLKDSVEEFL